jgi:hemerythrin superfamily protein
MQDGGDVFNLIETVTEASMNAIELLKNQHDEVEEMFERIQNVTGSRKAALFEKLADALERAQEKEQELFPKVRKLLSRDELDDLGMMMEDMAKELLGMGAPRMQVPSETAAPAPL